MSLYKKYVNNEIEISELNQKDFNSLMFEWYSDYKSRNGEKTFKEWLEFMEDYVL